MSCMYYVVRSCNGCLFYFTTIAAQGVENTKHYDFFFFLLFIMMASINIGNHPKFINCT